MKSYKGSRLEMTRVLVTCALVCSLVLSSAMVSPVAAQAVTLPGTFPIEFDVRGVYGVPQGLSLRQPTATQVAALNALRSRIGGSELQIR
ncbi:MAG: hypothetical protein MSG64_13905 [Pyrinomonadaceae bacterium MAG19_C2-C3]|nr:hypothetical protein [Pyrinomonadaceae bacterium MAG19_C2-C3]